MFRAIIVRDCVCMSPEEPCGDLFEGHGKNTIIISIRSINYPWWETSGRVRPLALANINCSLDVDARKKTNGELRWLRWTMTGRVEVFCVADVPNEI